MTTLRARLVLGLTALTAVVVLASGMVTWWVSRTLVLRDVDLGIERFVERVERWGARGPWRWPRPGPGTPNDTVPPRGPDGPGADWAVGGSRFLVVRSASGDELSRSDSCRGWPGFGRDAQPGDLGTTWRDDGLPVRWQVRPISHWPPMLAHAGDAPPPGPYVAVFGVAVVDEVAHLRRLADWLLLGAILATGFSAIGGLLLAETLLRPVRRLATDLDRITPADLSARIAASGLPRDLRPMVDRLNGLLGRVEVAFAREQSTIANIAHELRTPVAVLRSRLEFRLLAKPPAAEAAVLTTCLGTVERMQRLVSHLLLLARLEAGTETLTTEPVAVDVLVREHLPVVQDRATERHLTWAIDLAPSVLVPASAEHLRLVLANLLGNAAAHALPDTEVVVRLTAAALEIDNACPADLDGSALGRAFHRGDQARSGSDHAGLGLALCRRLADVQHFGLHLEAQGGRFRVRLFFLVAA